MFCPGSEIADAIVQSVFLIVVGLIILALIAVRWGNGRK